MRDSAVTVVGGGLAGSECALQLARRGVSVRLVEQRPVATSPAHHTADFAELVCSNSLKSTRHDSAAGLLKEELRAMGSILLELALKARLPAGSALAVDRERFSALVGERIEAQDLIEVERREVTRLPEGACVIAAGPLCSRALFDDLAGRLGRGALSFFDAAAPIVDGESLDTDIVFAQSRYEQTEGGDYLNCPLDRREYDAFCEELVSAERVVPRNFERAELFMACQPIEEVARSGHDSLRFGALKPVGLTDPRTGRRPWAVAQLRAENVRGSAYNLVGFQTNLRWGEQERVFRMIPGLAHADFFRYGVMHRNSFVDAPRVLDSSFAIPGTSCRLAGQICGTEGYTEAIASGLLAAINTYAELSGLDRLTLPKTSALGSLVSYATDPATEPYQPMHVNFGLVLPLEGPRLKKRERYRAYADRAMSDLERCLEDRDDLFGSSYVRA